jgi:hypothetical protein
VPGRYRLRICPDTELLEDRGQGAAHSLDQPPQFVLEAPVLVGGHDQAEHHAGTTLVDLVNLPSPGTMH